MRMLNLNHARRTPNHLPRLRPDPRTANATRLLELRQTTHSRTTTPHQTRQTSRPTCVTRCIPNHQCMTAILYVLRNGGEWSSLPKSLGAKSTMHDRFQEWNRAGVFEKIWTAALELLQYLEALDLEWQSMDGAMVKAPLGGKKNGTQPNGSGEIGSQTQPSRRWQRFAARTRDRRSEPA